MPGRSKERPKTTYSSYAGRWIARLGERLVGQGGTPEQAFSAAKASFVKETPEISYVPTEQSLLFSPLVDQIRAKLPAGTPAFLVGGAVRDALLGRATHDLDFVLPDNSIKVGRGVANSLGADFYVLDENRQTARVIYFDPQGIRHVVDFSLQRGPDLESDLRSRDFTINAIAVDIWQPLALLDPLGGASDLIAKNLRACSTTSFVDDPLRILRGLRLAAAYGLRIFPETRQYMRLAIPGLARVSPDRLRDELFRILGGSQPWTVIRVLDMLGGLSYVLPELQLLKGVAQTPPHTNDVWVHTLDVLQKLKILLVVLGAQFDPETSGNLTMGLVSMHLGRYRGQLSSHTGKLLNPERSVGQLLLMAALYHDAGKPQTRQVEESGRVRFFNHEEIGAHLVEERGQDLRLSNEEIERLVTIVRHQMRPLLLRQTGNKPSRRAVYRFFRDTGEAGVDICLLSLADELATYETTLPQNLWENHLEIVRVLMEAWWEKREERVRPPALVSGHDIMNNLGLLPGPQIGEILEAIREAQVDGQVQTREECLSFARKYIKS